MKYINKIDENFVRIFAFKYAHKYLTTDKVTVTKNSNFYEIIFILNDEQFKNHFEKKVIVNDFEAHSLSAFEEAIWSRAWRVALYKEFGDKYLEDLQNHINKEHEKTYKKKLSETSQLIKKIKDGKYDGYVK